jgi:hypothetical protein
MGSDNNLYYMVANDKLTTLTTMGRESADKLDHWDDLKEEGREKYII